MRRRMASTHAKLAAFLLTFFARLTLAPSKFIARSSANFAIGFLYIVVGRTLSVNGPTIWVAHSQGSLGPIVAWSGLDDPTMHRPQPIYDTRVHSMNLCGNRRAGPSRSTHDPKGDLLVAMIYVASQWHVANTWFPSACMTSPTRGNYE